MAYTLTYSYSNNAYTVTGYTGTPDNVVIPNTYDDGTHGEFPVTSIGEESFYDCSSLMSITIGNNVTSIETSAFENCSSLTSVTIPDSVTRISNDAFYDCSSLTSITIPDSVRSIEEDAFYNCPCIVTSKGISYVDKWLVKADTTITSATIKADTVGIADYAFSGCSSLTSITIPNSVTNIGEYAFYNCSSLTSITIPDSVTSIKSYTFQYCSNLTSINIPDSVASIGYDAFSYCSSLTSINIPDSVTVIRQYAFSHCSSLTSITIPNSVTSIGYAAFSVCSGLTSITIPNSVTSIDYAAFSGCSGLKSIILLPNTPPTLGANAFNYIYVNAKFYCRKSSEHAYKTATNWNMYESKIIGDDMALYFGMNANSTKKYVDSADALKVDKTTEIAGIQINNGISASELLNALFDVSVVEGV